MKIIQSLRNVLNPAMYHGHEVKPPFFEGWYYKLVSADGAQRRAIIPGVFLGENGHAFIQVLNGVTGQSAYHRFALQDFWADRQRFLIRIGPNEFSLQHIQLQVEDELGKVKGEVSFEGIKPWPVSLISPGIMGWYAWVPRMECYHGVLSLDHSLQGQLAFDQAGQLTNVDFGAGRGYIEKDWGQSFPQAWVWFQSNHFEQVGSSLTASVAVIPWLGSAFRGFIIGLWHDGRLYRFATYNGARIERLEIADDHVDWVVSRADMRLEMRASRVEGGLVLGPTRQEMGKRINETLKATVEVHLADKNGKTIFQGKGCYAGLEVHGDLEKLLAMK
jgi:tocopherol cyclase